MTLKLTYYDSPDTVRGLGYGDQLGDSYASTKYRYKQVATHPCEVFVSRRGYWFMHAPGGVGGRFCGKNTSVGICCQRCEKRHNVYMCNTHFNLCMCPSDEGYRNAALREDFPELFNE